MEQKGCFLPSHPILLPYLHTLPTIASLTQPLPPYPCSDICLHQRPTCLSLGRNISTPTSPWEVCAHVKSLLLQPSSYRWLGTPSSCVVKPFLRKMRSNCCSGADVAKPSIGWQANRHWTTGEDIQSHSSMLHQNPEMLSGKRHISWGGSLI